MISSALLTSFAPIAAAEDLSAQCAGLSGKTERLCYRNQIRTMQNKMTSEVVQEVKAPTMRSFWRFRTSNADFKKTRRSTIREQAKSMARKQLKRFRIVDEVTEEAKQETSEDMDKEEVKPVKKPALNNGIRGRGVANKRRRFNMILRNKFVEVEEEEVVEEPKEPEDSSEGETEESEDSEEESTEE